MIAQTESLLDADEVSAESLLANFSLLREGSQLALSNLQRTADLVRRLRRSSIDLDVMERRAFSLREVIDDVLLGMKEHLEQDRVSVDLDCNSDLIIDGIPGLFEQLMNSLVGNVLRHAFPVDGRQGKVTIAAWRAENGTLHLRCSDNGKGMAPDVAEHIFEPFFTTQRATGQLGLGMYMCYNLVVSRLGGRIDCISRPGEGTKIQVVVPAALGEVQKMKLIRSKTNDEAPPPREACAARHSWKILVVDDEADIRTLTRLNLKGFSFDGREIEFLEAASAYEARQILESHHDIAVALIDVVMETDDAGLKLVEYIRQTLNNAMMRLVIRTGQPGVAPERYVIDNFDIDDYKDKTELTATRLYTTVRSSIKAYRDLKTIDLNRVGLAQVLAAAPELYRISTSSLNAFFEGVLTQIVGLCHLADMSFISTIDGLIATFDGRDVMIRATTGPVADQQRFDEIRQQCIQAVQHGGMPGKIRQRGIVIPLTVGVQPVGFVLCRADSRVVEQRF